MKILVGIDNSACSKEALRLVRTIRWPVNARFVVLSAVPTAAAAYAVPGEPGAYGAYTEAIEGLTKAHEEFTALAEHELRSAGLQTEARVAPGDPGQVIVELAEKEKVDLVVVGSHGRSGLSKLLMGSVASHVVTHAPCSVLVVKPRK